MFYLHLKNQPVKERVADSSGEGLVSKLYAVFGIRAKYWNRNTMFILVVTN